MPSGNYRIDHVSAFVGGLSANVFELNQGWLAVFLNVETAIRRLRFLNR